MTYDFSPSNRTELLHIPRFRVVNVDEIRENEYNLNIPRYVDTFEPEPRMEVADALRELRQAENAAREAELELQDLLKGLGYAIG